MTGFLSDAVERGAIAPDWAGALQEVDGLITSLIERLQIQGAAGQQHQPRGDEIFAAFRRPLSNVRVVIVGQDPYPTPGYPTGLSFSVSASVRPVPASLRNIYTELTADLGHPGVPHGDLRPWADQGVLLLNRVLTVRPAKPGSHRGWGWEEVTAAALRGLAARDAPCAAILWGKDAQQSSQFLPDMPVLASVHPSPLSARRGFFGSKPFSRTNSALRAQGAPEIDWALPRNV